ncbi:MAG: acyltransferase [Eubacterium sp.]
MGVINASLNSKIIIGDNCLISYNVHMRTDMHNYLQKDKLINKQGHTEKNIIIGNDVWIGYGVQIMHGVTIGDGAVIGAGAIVTKDIESYSVYVGIPAKKNKRTNLNLRSTHEAAIIKEN